MNAVLQRELVVQARQARTFWLRFFAGLALATNLGAQIFSLGDLVRAMGLWRGAPTGAELFAGLHTVISVILLFTAPLIAADSIARERREGTLGLLALTPLQPFEIVLGKVGAHVIRLFSLWLLSVPMLMVPVLVGGVNWVDIKCALGIELTILCMGLAAGMIASTIALQGGNVAALAGGLTFLFGHFVASGVGFSAVILAHLKGVNQISERWAEVALVASLVPWAAATGMVDGGFGPMLSRNPAALLSIDAVLIAMVALAGISLAGAVRFCGRRMARLLRQDAGAATKQSFQTPIGVAKVLENRPTQRERLRWLVQNPARWLFSHSSPNSGGRWTKPIFMAGLGLIGLVGAVRYDHVELLLLLSSLQVIALSIGIGFEVAASFRRELEEGSLEILLVSGLPSRKLIWGRVTQLWGAYLPSVAISFSCLLMALIWNLNNHNLGAAVVVWICGATSVFGTVPIGVRYAVRRLIPLHGWAWTLLTAGFPPLLLGWATSVMFWGMRRGGDMGDFNSMVAFVFGFAVTQFALARTWFWLAANDLQTRLFMLKPFQRRPC
jgi:ABC-type transport system involved in multi-copper enzyme maturation permease subunit